MATEVGSAYVTLIPSARGFASKMQSELGNDIAKAGDKGGDQYGTEFSQSASKNVGKHGKGIFSSLGKAAIVAGVAAGAALTKLALGSISEARDAQVVGARTANVIKSMGNASKISAKQVADLAGALSTKAGVDDEAIQTGQNLLLTFGNIKNEAGKGNKIFNQTTGLMVDMSVAMGQDMSGSAIQLGKALNDPVKGVSALSRVGVSFTAQQKEQIKALQESGNTLAAQKVILGEVKKQFGGAAASMSNPAQKATVAWGNLKEQIGTSLLPVVDKMATIFVTTVAPALSLFIKQMQQGRGTGGKVRDVIESIVNYVKQIDWGGIGASIKSAFGNVDKEHAGDAFKTIRDSASDLGPVLKDIAAQIPSLNDMLSVTASVMHFAATHTDLLRKALPFLAAGFVAVKVAQAAAHLAAVIALPTKIAEVVVNRQLIKSNRALVASRNANTVAQEVQTVATAEGTVAQEANTAVQNQGILATLRAKVAAIASAVAQKAVAAATKVWAAMQWLLNAALTANPIGLVVVAIGLLIGALVLAWAKSDRFRAIVTAAFDKVKAAASAAFGWVKQHWPLILAILTGPIGLAVLAIVKNWDKIKAGASAVVEFIKSIPGKIGALAGKFASVGGDLIHAFIDGLAGAANLVSDVAGNIWDAVKGLLNDAIDKLNGALMFRISVLGKGVTIDPPDIPHLASGARANGATLAVIGEGREAETVLPDSLLRGLLERTAAAAQRGGVGLLTITNWRDGTGYFRVVADDAVRDDAHFRRDIGVMHA